MKLSVEELKSPPLMCVCLVCLCICVTQVISLEGMLALLYGRGGFPCGWLRRNIHSFLHQVTKFRTQGALEGTKSGGQLHCERLSVECVFLHSK